MKNTRLKRILNVFLLLTLAIVIGVGAGTTLGKYVFTGEVGSFSLKIVPRIVPAEAIMRMVPEGGTLTRIVYDRWSGTNYTDGPITIENWDEGKGGYDPSQPDVRMFAKPTGDKNFTVYVLSPDIINAPVNASGLFSGTKHSGAFKDSVEEIVLQNFQFPESAKDAAGMFSGCSALKSIDLSGVDFTGVTMRDAFKDSASVTSVNLTETKWYSHKALRDALNGIENSLETLDLTLIDIKNVSQAVGIFADCKALTNITGIKDFDIDKIRDIRNIFSGCNSLRPATFSEFAEALKDTNLHSDLNSFADCFLGCWQLNNQNLHDILSALATKTTATYKYTQMFSGCTGLTGDIDLSEINLNNAANLNGMFSGCDGINSVILFKTENITTVKELFKSCNALHTVDLSKLNTSNVTDMSSMFNDCTALTTVKVGDGWNTEKVTSSANMFLLCNNLKGGKDTTLQSMGNIIDKTYARIDGKDGQPGYFTDINASAPPAVALDTSGMQNLSAELMDLGSTFIESGKHSYGILLTPDEGFLLPETFTITIGEMSYTVSTTPDGQNPEGFAWFPEDNLLVISGDLLSTGGTIFITAEAVHESTETETDLMVTDPTEPTVTDPTEPTATDPTEPTVTDPTNPTVTNSTEPTATDPTDPTTASEECELPLAA